MKIIFCLLFLLLTIEPSYAKTVEIGASLTAQKAIELTEEKQNIKDESIEVQIIETENSYSLIVL